MTKHFLDLMDFTNDEVYELIELGRMLKRADKLGACPHLLDGASLGMIFDEPSTRTRISFEVAMTKLGGHALYLRPGEIHLGKSETVKDTALVMSRLLDAIEIRSCADDEIAGLAEHASIPVINGMGTYLHPCQCLCDLMTMSEHLPTGKALSDVTLVFVGDATVYENVGTALSHILPRLGAHFVYCAPEGYVADEAFYAPARRACEEGGGTFEIVHDPKQAVRDADYIYSSVMWYDGFDADREKRMRDFLPDYQINEDLIACAPAHAEFMHYLPAQRGFEMTDAVMDHERSLLWDGAENRLYGEMAILVKLMRGRLPHASAEVKAQQKALIETWIAENL
ncbi:ornithine carbamoyltransferase [Arabiibacter massiliensis]|uniref:ornithine carbamoyltransferase n=1 Tax=Arabiibacter massiliensis TaxID=1870985 RepID=UPI0009BBDFE0|nr:ornithine carbamoyltransferase [Arabiibacter massiliensis]